MIQHRRQDSARPAGGGRYDASARSVLFGGGQRIRIDVATRIEAPGIALGLDVIGGSLATHPDTTGQNSLVIETAIYRFAHHMPDLLQVIPDFRAFTPLDIFPKGAAVSPAQFKNLCNRRQRIDVVLHMLRLLIRQCPASDTVNRPAIFYLPLRKSFKQHPVRMKRQKDLGSPDYFGGCNRFQHLEDRPIGHVPTTGRCQAAIQRYSKIRYS